MVIRPAGALLMLCCATACGGAHDGMLRVEDARALEALDTTGASAYFTIVNGTDRDDTLLGIASDVAERIQIHSGAMQPMADVPVPAGDAVRLEPGSMHAMLQHLHAKPVAGDTVVFTLTFRHAGAVTVAAPVVRYRDLQQ